MIRQIKHLRPELQEIAIVPEAEVLLERYVPSLSTICLRDKRSSIAVRSNELMVNVASIWEITLKVQSSKLKLPTVAEFLESNLQKLGVRSYLP